MEPMAVVNSPSTPSSPAFNSNFLPNFLTSEPLPSTPFNPGVSPGRNKTPGSFRNTSINLNESRNLRQSLFNQSWTDSPAPQSSPFVQAAERTGPPKTALFDTIDAAKKGASAPLNNTPKPNESAQFNESSFRTFAEDSFNVNRSSNGPRPDSQWVTVFGFPPTMLNLVMAHLGNCGAIVDKRMSTNSNWVHVRFSNPNEVAKALALNGRCITSNVMVGVQLYYDREDKENGNVTMPVRARSLRHSFVSPSSTNNVITPYNVPQKSTGIVSKAMEYVFGW